MYKIISIFLIIALSLGTCVSSFAQFRNGEVYRELYDSEAVAALKNHVRALSASHLEGRKAGSEGEKEAAEYVRSAFKSYGVDVLSPADGDIFGGYKFQCRKSPRKGQLSATVPKRVLPSHVWKRRASYGFLLVDDLIEGV